MELHGPSGGIALDEAFFSLLNIGSAGEHLVLTPLRTSCPLPAFVPVHVISAHHHIW
jgi:hypothetical protein